MIDNEPVAWLMVNREDGNRFIQMGKPTRDDKVGHEPQPLYTQETIEEIKALWYSKGHADGAKIREDYLALRTYDGKEE